MWKTTLSQDWYPSQAWYFFIQLSIWASIIRGCILGREFLIEGSKLNLQGQGDSKNKRVGWKGSLAEAIVPIGGM